MEELGSMVSKWIVTYLLMFDLLGLKSTDPNLWS